MIAKHRGRLPRGGGALILAALWLAFAAGCDSDQTFARALRIETMAQTIGGPAAAGRPDDLLLENDKIRAVIRGQLNKRSTFPLLNGSLMDLDLQRPFHSAANGGGKDAFYELGPMINLKISGGTEEAYGTCDEVGSAPCPETDSGEVCARVSAAGKADNLLGIVALLDLAIQRRIKGQSIYDPDKMYIATDYDLCPGESFVRVTTTVSFGDADKPATVDLEDLKGAIGLPDALLGEHTGQDCAKEPCPAGQECDDLLLPLAAGGLNLEMKRCRRPEQKVAGILSGDWIFFSGKVNVFIGGSGFDHESYIRSLFDAGGDVFSNPLSMPVVAGVGDDVSYAYFNATGQVIIPIFSDSFTASMTNRFACPRSDPGCVAGKQLRYRRFVSVGKGDVASALRGFYDVQRIPYGEVSGHVVDRTEREPLSHADVFAFKVPEAWAGLTDGQLGRKTYDELVAQNRAESSSAGNPDGNPGIISQFRTDVGEDQIADGSFSGPLAVAGPAAISCPSPQCRYVLATLSKERSPSGLYPITVRKGSMSKVTLVAGHSSTLEYVVKDAAGRLLPSKLTIGHCFAECARDADCGQEQVCDTTSRLCRPAGGYASPGSCRPDQHWDASQQTCVCGTGGELPLYAGGRRNADNTIDTVLAPGGRGQIKLPPGRYQVIVSRGLEYEISRHFVDLRPELRQRLESVLTRSVDTKGWISADFHVHGPNSVDSGLNHHTRVASYVAEGVELLSASDHDNLTDYGPTIVDMGLQTWIKSQIGLEVSPLDYGHFIGFPLRFDENAELNGAFHWRVNDPGGDPGWKNMTPPAIFKKLRELGSLGLDKTVVFVAHFYDHFTYYSVNPFNMQLEFNFQSLFNPILAPTNFSGEFDALEAFNGKGFDIIRRPTSQEIRDYNVELARTLEQSRDLPYAARQRAMGEVSAAAQRRIIERTADEQVLALSGGTPSFQCRCTQDADCGNGWLCDADIGNCVAACSSDSHCDGDLVAAGREACLQKGEGSPQRRTCQRVPLSCTTDADCSVTFNGASETCQGGSCAISCSADADCKDPLRPRCGEQGVCTVVAHVAADAPCPTLRGTVDDWFQLLNRGVRRPVLGNSDSHGTYGTEGGIPRNYVRSSTDLPSRIDSTEVAAQVHAMHTFPSYGPFVELTVGGKGYGSVVEGETGKAVTLSLRVQSPTWFDVDRIELYRNGQLIKIIEGSESCDDRSRCIRLPNDSVVNFEGQIEDKPTRDAWYVAVVMGINGRTLAPVYSSTPVARLGLFEIIQRLTPLLPPLRSFRTPLSPSMSRVRPYAMTNPIWVDIGGDGLTPVAEPPNWATERDLASMKLSSTSQSLSSPDGAAPLQAGSATQRNRPHWHGGLLHSHADQAGGQPPAHDHRLGLGRMRLDTQRLQQMMQTGAITPAMVQQALDQLRYY